MTQSNTSLTFNKFIGKSNKMDCEKLISYVFEHKILYDQSLPEYKDNDRKHNVWKTIAVNMECGGMFGLYVNKYLKFLKCFDISLQSSRNIHQNRIVMLRNVYVCATELPFNSSRMPAVGLRELFRNLCL